MQSSSRNQPFKLVLAGASPATDAKQRQKDEGRRQKQVSTGCSNEFCIPHSAFYIYFRSQGVMSSARRSAKAEVRGANPRESARAMVIMM
jgi:hypothetical protein